MSSADEAIKLRLLDATTVSNVAMLEKITFGAAKKRPRADGKRDQRNPHRDLRIHA